MAILYYMKVTNPNNVALFPPALNEGVYDQTLKTALISVPRFGSDSGSVLQIFADVAALTAFTNSIALSGANLAAMNEWKTANNITIEYSIFGLTATADTPPTPF